MSTPKITYVLEIDWVDGVDLPCLVGPFTSRDEAVEWGQRNIPNGEWGVSQLTYPYAQRPRT